MSSTQPLGADPENTSYDAARPVESDHCAIDEKRLNDRNMTVAMPPLRHRHVSG